MTLTSPLARVDNLRRSLVGLKMWGKSGRIGARLIYVQANDRRLRLSGSMDDKGVTGTGGVVAAAILVPVVGFFLTGISAAIAPGSHTTGYL